MKIDELRDRSGAHLNTSGERCSDKGFLNMSVESYIELLRWTARHISPGKRGITRAAARAVLERRLQPAVWYELVVNFGELFCLVAGRPTVVDAARSLRSHSRFHATPRLRKLQASLGSESSAPRAFPRQIDQLSLTPHSAHPVEIFSPSSSRRAP